MRKLLLVTTCSAALSLLAVAPFSQSALAQADQQKHEAPSAEAPAAKTPQTEKRNSAETAAPAAKENKAADETRPNAMGNEKRSADEAKPDAMSKERRATDETKPGATSNDRRATDETKPDTMSKERRATEEKREPGKANMGDSRDNKEMSHPTTGQAQDKRENETRSRESAQDKKEHPANREAAHVKQLDEHQASEFKEKLRKAGRLSESNVHFSVRVGVGVPASVRLETLPVEIVTEYPEFRDYDYVVVEDQIVIVDPQTREVAEVVGEPPTTRAAAVNPCSMNQ